MQHRTSLPLIKAMLSVLTFNILAPHFANGSHYPPGIGGSLQQQCRRQGTTRFILQVKESYDILAFQEVSTDGSSHDELAYLNNILQDEFVGMFYPHESHYWNDYGKYIPNGNALFFRRSIFGSPNWSNVSLLTGNHAVLAEITHIPSMRQFRVLNVHFDSESECRRNYELAAALSTLPPDPNMIDIIVGDFNMESTDKSYNIVRRVGFCTIDSNTPSFSFMTDGPIDHIIYRDLNRSAFIPTANQSRVLDCGLWSKYPRMPPIDILMTPRLKECLKIYGSDHLPVLAVFMVTPNIITTLCDCD